MSLPLLRWVDLATGEKCPQIYDDPEEIGT